MTAKHTPSLVWQIKYAHDRRAHRHRCIVCRRILETGDDVLMYRAGNKKTRAAHFECSNVSHPCGTYRDAMTEWAWEQVRDARFNKFDRRDWSGIAQLRQYYGLKAEGRQP